MPSIKARSGGNATGLPGTMPSEGLSRRAALQSSAAAVLGFAIGAAPALGAAAPACRDLRPVADAALLNLAHHVETLVICEQEAWDSHSKAEDAVFKATPPVPIRREVRGPYADLDGLGPEQRFAKLFADPVDFWAASDAADAEHRVAMAEHASTVALIEQEHGVARLKRAARRMSKQLTAAVEDLAEMRPTTSAGLAAKAGVVLAVDRNWSGHADLVASVLRDVVRFNSTGEVA